MSVLRHDCAATDAALESLLDEIALLHDMRPNRARSPKADPHQWALLYLREIAADGDLFDGLRSDLSSRGRKLLAVATGNAIFEGYTRQLRVTLATLDFVLAALGEIPLIEICSTCGLPSTRRYCDECARERNLEAYENPAHQV